MCIVSIFPGLQEGHLFLRIELVRSLDNLIHFRLQLVRPEFLWVLTVVGSMAATCPT